MLVLTFVIFFPFPLVGDLDTSFLDSTLDLGLDFYSFTLGFSDDDPFFSSFPTVACSNPFTLPLVLIVPNVSDLGLDPLDLGFSSLDSLDFDSFLDALDFDSFLDDFDTSFLDSPLVLGFPQPALAALSEALLVISLSYFFA